MRDKSSEDRQFVKGLLDKFHPRFDMRVILFSNFGAWDLSCPLGAFPEGPPDLVLR